MEIRSSNGPTKMTISNKPDVPDSKQADSVTDVNNSAAEQVAVVSNTMQAVGNFGGSGGNSGNNGGQTPMWIKILPIAAALIAAWIVLNLFINKEADNSVAEVTQAADEAVTAAEQSAADATETATEAADEATEAATDAASDAAETATDAAAEATETVTDAASDTAEAATEAADEATDAVADAASETTEATTDAAADATETVTDEASDTAETSTETATDDTTDTTAEAEAKASNEADSSAQADTTASTTSIVERGSFDLGGVSRKIGGIFGTTSAVLENVSDADSANAALPRLESATMALEEVVESFSNIPDAARGPLTNVIKSGIAKLKPLADTAFVKEGVGPILMPVIGPMFESLSGLIQ